MDTILGLEIFVAYKPDHEGKGPSRSTDHSKHALPTDSFCPFQTPICTRCNSFDRCSSFEHVLFFTHQVGANSGLFVVLAYACDKGSSVGEIGIEGDLIHNRSKLRFDSRLLVW